MSAAIDRSALRKDFPILDQQVHGQPPVYFDNAATSQKPLKPFDESRALTGVAQNAKTRL